MAIELKDGGHEVVLKQPVVLSVVFTNQSTETFNIFRPFAAASDADYAFRVTTPSGKEAKIERSLEARFAPSVKGNRLKLLPNGMLKVEVEISAYYDFNELGAYKVTALRSMRHPGGNNEFTVVSNPVTINVVPRE